MKDGGMETRREGSWKIIKLYTGQREYSTGDKMN